MTSNYHRPGTCASCGRTGEIIDDDGQKKYYQCPRCNMTWMQNGFSGIPVGLFTPVTAIGSVCQRKKTKELKEYILFITSLEKNVNWHTFGMQISVLKDPEIANRLWSSDSGAWKFKSGCTNGIWKPSRYEDKLSNFLKYSLKINETILGDSRFRNLAESV